jgi:hypothetical protein
MRQKDHTMTNQLNAFSPDFSNRGPSLVDECLQAIANANNRNALDQVASDNRTLGSVFSALAPNDKTIVRMAWAARLATLTMNAIPSTPVAPVAPTTTVEQSLASISANAASNAVARRGRPAGSRNTPRTLSPTEIATATRVARLAGARLAGYDGRIVEPGKGIGTVITLGNSIREYDEVSDRNRQVLIPWSDVESVRVACNLPIGSFGRAPGLVGILGDATQILNHGGFVARRSKSGGKFASAWKIGYFDNRIDSDSLGRKEALITLTHGGEISCDMPDHPGAKAVLADYDRRVSATLIPSDDLARRIVNCLKGQFSARDTDLGIFVPPFASPGAVDLVVALRPIAGRRIYASAYTDRGTLGEALSDSLVNDLGKLETDCTEGKIGAPTLLARCEKLRVECSGLVSILGDSYEGIKARILACDAQAVKGMDARAANLELS